MSQDHHGPRKEMLAGIVALAAGPIGPYRYTDDNVGVYRQGAHLHLGMQEAKAAGTENLEDVEQRAVEADLAVLEDAGSDALQAAYRMALVEDVLKRYHPDFGDRPRRERIELLMRGAEHFDRAWWALDALGEYARAGKTEGLPRKRAKNPERDMRAAELKDARDLDHREIGEILGIPRTVNDKKNSDYGSVRRAIRRGRERHEERLGGEEGYREHIEALRRWYALDPRERTLRRMTKIFGSLPGSSPEEAEALRPDFERLVDEHLSEDDQPPT